MAKSSGTTSGAKYIPITKQSIQNQIRGARNSLLTYIGATGDASFLDGKMMFLSGSPELDNSNPVAVGRLSGIVNHHVPSYLLKNRLPSNATNVIEDWETKVEAVVQETKDADLRLLSGIPPWVIMYLEKLQEATGRSAGKLLPSLSLYIHGGVNYAPYKSKMSKLIGENTALLETYPASEGFIAYQDEWPFSGNRLIIDDGIFYEFIPAHQSADENPQRLNLQQVEVGINYEVVLHTNAGLWGYRIGDVVRFTSLTPFRIEVVGRTQQYISAFGEHVIASEVEGAIDEAAKRSGAIVSEFTAAPLIAPTKGLPSHVWLVEFEVPPIDETDFRRIGDAHLQKLNPYYKDLRAGKMLQEVRLVRLPKGTMHTYLATKGKLGGQNKVPRLRNDRKVADEIVEALESSYE